MKQLIKLTRLNSTPTKLAALVVFACLTGNVTAQAPTAATKPGAAVPTGAPPKAAVAAPAPAPAQAQAPATVAPAATATQQPAQATSAPAARAVGAASTAGKMQVTPGGVKYEDILIGTGAVAKAGQTVTVHYTGWLLEGATLGRKFDSSKDRAEPFKFPLGGGRVIKGWDEGVAGMKVGGKRTLTIPPEMGYGARGAGGVIPPGATLVFEVELLGV